MQKLVIIAPHLGRSGPTRQMIYLASELCDKFDIEILGVQPEKNSNLKSELVGFPVRFTLSTKRNFLLRWLRLLALALSGRIDVFHSYGFLPDLLCALVVPRKKWVSVARNFPPEDYPPKFGPALGGFMARVHLGVHRKCKYLVACSQSLGKAYQRIGIHNTPIRNAVRVPAAAAGFEKKGTAQRLVFLGNLIPRKRVDLTCRLFEALKNNHAEMDIVGGGSELEALRGKYGKNPRIHFHGPQADVWQFIANAHILINLSASEGLPNAVLEGLSAGCICLLSDIEPHKEIGESIGAGVIILAATDSPTEDELAALAAKAESKLAQIPDDQRQINIDRAQLAFGTSRLAEEFERHYATMGAGAC